METNPPICAAVATRHAALLPPSKGRARNAQSGLKEGLGVAHWVGAENGATPSYADIGLKALLVPEFVANRAQLRRFQEQQYN